MSHIPPELRAKLSGGIAKNIGWLLGDRIARLTITVLVGAITARYLGPSSFGQLAYAVSFVAFFQAVANLGADTIVVRDFIRHPKNRGEILGSLLAVRAIVGMICWGGAVLLALSFQDGHGVLLIAIVGLMLVLQASDSFDLWFQSQLQSRRTVVARFPGYLLSNAIRLALVMAGLSVVWFAGALAFDAAITAASLYFAYRRFPVAEGLSASVARMRAIVAASFPFMLSGLSVIVYMRIDQIMLKQMRGDHELGIFAAALPFAQIWQIIPMTLAVSLAPSVARRKLEGQAGYEETLLLIYRAFGAGAIVAAIATALVAPIVVPLFYGPRFSESVPVLAVLAFTNISVALGVAQSLWIANENAGTIGLAKTLTGGVVAVGCNFLLIPRYGALGAAISANISFFTSAVLSNLIFAPETVLMQLGINRKLPWRGILPRKTLGHDIHRSDVEAP